MGSFKVVKSFERIFILSCMSYGKIKVNYIYIYIYYFVPKKKLHILDDS